MKAAVCTFLLLLGLMVGQGQLLTSVPVFPQDTGTVSILVDCSKGNQGLYNYANTSDVYVHVGVITSSSTGPSDWRYVPFTWGTANAAAQATYLGNNKYRYTINGIRSFFNVPAGETILAVAVLFRNGSGSQAQRNTDGSDMFVTVYPAGKLAAKFLAPAFQPHYLPVPEPITKSLGDSLPIRFVTDKSASISLSFNGAAAGSATAADSLVTALHLIAAGSQQVIASATDGITSVSDTLNFYIGGAVNIAPLPAGAKEGINYPAGDTSALLVLYAPFKHKIVVVGDFNNWTQQPAYQMNETPDSNYFWVQINGLTPGKEYAYQYVIDDALQLADYNTEKVLDKNVDPQILSSTYPNLKAFPSGAAGTLASVIQTAQPAYNWQATNFQRPDKKNLVIYELWLADFTAAGNWQGLIDTLGYLKRLGVNAIEVEPFTNFEGAVSWGYNPNFYFAPEKVYGTSDDVRRFVDACHQQGMAVIMDMVMNHSFGSSPMLQMYWDGALGVPAANNPWFNQYPTHAFNVGYQFNHQSAATVRFTQRVIEHWLTKYHIDGFRWDLAKGFTQTRTCDAQGNNCDVAAWGHYDAARVATWDTIYNQMQAASPGSYCILEMFADNSEQQVEANYGMLLWGEDLSGNYSQATMGYNSPSPGGATWDLTGSIYTTLGGWNAPGLVVYQDSHDDDRLQYNNEQYGNSSGGYSIRDTATGLARDAMATAFWALAPGPKMVTEFSELGFDYSINWCTNGTVDPSGSCRLVPKPVRWDYLRDSARKKLHDVHAALLRLLGDYPALRTGQTTYSLAGNVKYLQVISSDLTVVVVGNFDVVSATSGIPFPTSGTWYDYLSGNKFQVAGATPSMTLAAGEYHVYTNHNLGGIDTTTPPPAPVSAQGLAIYPNPAGAGSATITYRLPTGGSSVLEVYSISGARVATLDLGSQAAGIYSLPAGRLSDPAGLPNGLYVLKLVSTGITARFPFLVIH
ncbi:MAG TPA: alpha-amylase family glycosyl hydrolase [Puia sp.]|nr:alpha-amylase family glycosyl hydrolase [Puia sp.]